MVESNRAEKNAAAIQLYTAYLDDLGRLGSRHENSRKFYVSVISALFVFLSMAGGDGLFVKVDGKVLLLVAIVGVVICLAWFEHMRSFSMLYAAKLHTLRVMETQMENGQAGLKPFMIETKFLVDPNSAEIKWRYRPLTGVDSIAPIMCSVLFAALFFLK